MNRSICCFRTDWQGLFQSFMPTKGKQSPYESSKRMGELERRLWKEGWRLRDGVAGALQRENVY